jgi:hypothetical protein
MLCASVDWAVPVGSLNGQNGGGNGRILLLPGAGRFFAAHGKQGRRRLNGRKPGLPDFHPGIGQQQQTVGRAEDNACGGLAGANGGHSANGRNPIPGFKRPLPHARSVQQRRPPCLVHQQQFVVIVLIQVQGQEVAQSGRSGILPVWHNLVLRL